ncbi:hypothetical protein LXG23DRAFT_51437 [Yarrowia lipolytica]|uniref:Uncharacterized protein n=1 Tax=Yarrowia lipolytica TaxID=4952 RepID=A0A1D8N5T8_YARLL|nr:hypothetical protein YALI1_B00383g [Yarrowia lipolytica]KAJ8051932.1 hypothetical protein LXG23DRAFT_51437 [Yarrowia lipolytica]
MRDSMTRAIPSLYQNINCALVDLLSGKPGICNIYSIGPILGQFAVHILALMYEVYKIGLGLMDLDRKCDPPFSMNLFQLASQLSTISASYHGRTFPQSIRENRPLYFGL